MILQDEKILLIYVDRGFQIDISICSFSWYYVKTSIVVDAQEKAPFLFTGASNPSSPY